MDVIFILLIAALISSMIDRHRIKNMQQEINLQRWFIYEYEKRLGISDEVE